MLLLTHSWPVFLGVKPPPNLGLKTKFLLLLDSCGFVDVGHLSDEGTGLLFTIAAEQLVVIQVFIEFSIL
jgi:hypothetical protein